ncbi:MAG: helix-hairpin-helix domain-containing protein [Melioribacteraceae bacterium]|nr:helix-hairpin-helix domain-containing protein [Melioribacteraceae bacterium]
MAIIELVDYNVIETKKSKKTKKTDTEPAKKVKETSAKKVAKEEVVEAEFTDVPENDSDDLTKVEGIGPKISEILTTGGIDTFAKLAETDVEKLSELLAEAGSRYKSHDPSTWPQQAKLAAEGNWDELKKLQDELDGGRETK